MSYLNFNFTPILFLFLKLYLGSRSKFVVYEYEGQFAKWIVERRDSKLRGLQELQRQRTHLGQAPTFHLVLFLAAGADPGFDQGGAPDRDRPKTAILGPQFCRILVLGPHFWWSGGGPGPRGPPPGSAPVAGPGFL